MKRRNLLVGALSAASAAVAVSSASAQAQDSPTTVTVALLDMSSVMGSGMMSPGWNMMGQGQGMMAPGWNMWGQGQGMMDPGWNMMGMGMGRGMMGMMGMMSIRTDQATVKAGTVRFVVTNWSRSLIHEVIVVAVENLNAPLPYNYGEARIPEDQVRVIGEVEGLQPNGSGSIEVSLPAGNYLLICNVPGHFAAGMVAPLTVTS